MSTNGCFVVCEDICTSNTEKLGNKLFQSHLIGFAKSPLTLLIIFTAMFLLYLLLGKPWRNVSLVILVFVTVKSDQTRIAIKVCVGILLKGNSEPGIIRFPNLTS